MSKLTKDFGPIKAGYVFEIDDLGYAYFSLNGMEAFRVMIKDYPDFYDSASDSPSESTVERTVDPSERKPTIRTEIEACLPDLPRHALPYAVDAIMSKLNELIGEDEDANRPVPDFLIGETNSEIRNELRAEMRLRAGLTKENK